MNPGDKKKNEWQVSIRCYGCEPNASPFDEVSHEEPVSILTGNHNKVCLVLLHCGPESQRRHERTTFDNPKRTAYEEFSERLRTLLNVLHDVVDIRAMDPQSRHFPVRGTSVLQTALCFFT